MVRTFFDESFEGLVSLPDLKRYPNLIPWNRNGLLES